MEDQKIIGQTKTVGFQVGVRRTFDVSPEFAWEFLFSDQGIVLWLGKPLSMNLTPGGLYKAENGNEGIIKVFKPYSHIRLTWKKKEWQNASTLQIRVINSKGKATISFHQEKLLNVIQREEMKFHWEDVLSRIELLF